MRDISKFDVVLVDKGRKKILFTDEAQAVRSRQRRYRQPKPPRIQLLLKRAYMLKNRLDKTPGLTRDTLAREIGVTPTRLTMILNLLNLAPSIQKHILALPLSVRMGPLTERSLRPLARNRNWDFQERQVRRLLNLNGKAGLHAQAKKFFDFSLWTFVFSRIFWSSFNR